MIISMNWIKDYVDLQGIDMDWLLNQLTLKTAEIEEIHRKGSTIENVVVGKITQIQPHPHSDHLHIIQVDTGDELVQSICGAPNIYTGMVIPFAKVGGKIQGISTVQSHEMQGFISQGIACSERELGITEDHSGVVELPADAPLGKDIKELLPIEDVLVEIDNKSLTHRPDLWCHYGLAREIAAIALKPLLPVQHKPEAVLKEAEGDCLDIQVVDEKCLRYSAVAVKGVKTTPSPLYIKTRLYYCGMRPINLLVDLTNYIMLDIGQPLHAFDRRLADSVRVKSTQELLPFTTLDGVSRQIPPNTLMICNREKAMAIAGIMGGEESEVSPDTSSILLESATFDGAAIRKTASTLGLRTDASMRYEKFLDTTLTTLAIGRFIHLLQSVDSSVQLSSPLFDFAPQAIKAIQITLDHSFVENYLGSTIAPDTVLDILTRLQFQAQISEDRYTIQVPTFRATRDIQTPVDIVEEILRMYGYENIKSRPVIMGLTPIPAHPQRVLEYEIKDLLVRKFAFHEVHTYCWYDSLWLKKIQYSGEDGMGIINSGISQFERLRTHIIPNLLQVMEKNYKNSDELGIFELGRTYHPGDKDVHQPKHLGALLYRRGGEQEGREAFLHMKGICDYVLNVLKNGLPEYRTENLHLSWLHGKRQLKIYYQKTVIGYMGALHPAISNNLLGSKSHVIMLDLDIDRINALQKKETSYQPVSKYPETLLDFSLLSPKTMPFSQIAKAVEAFQHPYLLHIRYTSTYEGENLPSGAKSTTFRLRVGSSEKTLSLQEINDVKDLFLAHIQSCGLEIR